MILTDWWCRRRHHPLTKGGATLRSCPCEQVWYVDARDPEAAAMLRIRAHNSTDPATVAFLTKAAQHIEENA